MRAVRSRREFDALSHSRRRGRSGPLWMVTADHLDPEDRDVAVAYAIGRPVGSAVVRNRLRRRLRELMRTRADSGDLRGLYLVGASPDATDATFSELGDHLDRALDQLS